MNIDRAKLDQSYERAAKFHRLEMAHRATPLELTYEIGGVPVSATTIIVQPDGWAPIGHVRDEVELWDLTVWWNPTTDRIKLENPPSPRDPAPAAALVGDPLYPTNPVH